MRRLQLIFLKKTTNYWWYSFLTMEKKKILIADDNENIRDALTYLLEDVVRPRLDLLPGHVPFDRVVIVRDLKRAETELADIDGRDLVLPAAFTTSQALY